MVGIDVCGDVLPRAHGSPLCRERQVYVAVVRNTFATANRSCDKDDLQCQQ